MPTDGGLAELLLCHLIGDVGSHEDGHGDAQFGPDDLRDQLQTLGARIHALERVDSKGIEIKEMPSRPLTATETAADIGSAE